MQHKQHIIPTHFKSKFQSDDTLVLGFAPYTLDEGVCYKLKFGQPRTGMMGMAGQPNPLAAMMRPDFDHFLDMTICTSSCACDVLGTLECIEEEVTG